MELDLIGKKIADNFDFGLIVENINREVTFCNQKFLDIFDIKEQSKEIIGKNAEQIAVFMRPHFKDIELFEWGLKELPQKCIKYENTFNTLLNRTIKVKYIPLFIDSVIERHVWQFEDITELELKNLEIKKQREYYLKILNRIPSDIIIANVNHEFEFINEHAISNNLRREALIGMNANDYLKGNISNSSEIVHARNENFKLAIHENRRVDYVEEIPSTKGGISYIYRSLQPVLNEDNKIDFVLISGTDITKQVESETNKQILNSRFDKLINKINDAVFQIDFNGKIIFINQAAFDLFPFFGKTQEGLFAFVNTQLISFADRMQCLRPIVLVKQNKSEVNGVLRIGNEDNGILFLKYSYWYTNNTEDGETILGSVTDVTNQYVEMNAMKFAIEKEQQLNSMKSKFINITSHEIRTPLSVILSSAEIIDLTLPKENPNLIVNPKDYTQTIMQEVHNVTNILNELLIVGSIESPNSKFKGEMVEIQSFVASSTTKYLPYIDGRALQVFYSVEPSEQIFIDKKLMKHALDNLLNNAFKYSSGKKDPILSIFKKDNNLIFSIQDFGIGIPADEVNNLFHSFYRASNVSNISGTGIGLMVVEHAAKMHKGAVEVYSVLNELTVFKLIIPNSHQ
ncbi:MAG: PAS domain-containing sensor histidine kinase [Bacteroidetes bacterium]|nr:PAS domain-containing sensor histidine kinase [Bacteroidota bacterium]